jgi:hypothetical protein
MLAKTNIMDYSYAKYIQFLVGKNLNLKTYKRVIHDFDKNFGVSAYFGGQLRKTKDLETIQGCMKSKRK